MSDYRVRYRASSRPFRKLKEGARKPYFSYDYETLVYNYSSEYLVRFLGIPIWRHLDWHVTQEDAERRISRHARCRVNAGVVSEFKLLDFKEAKL